MANFRPIPVRILCHTATHTSKAGGTWEFPSKTTIELKRVRFDGKSNLTYNAGGSEMKCALAMFYDCTNSLPKDHLFKEGDSITWGARNLTIKTIQLCYTTEQDGLHHIELGLV